MADGSFFCNLGAMKRILLFWLLLSCCAWAQTIEVRKGGSFWADIESDGYIRISGSLVGRVESDGDVRKNGSLVGKVESDGYIRKNGSLIGRVESDGTLRLNGTSIGRIESDGTIRKGGSYWGKASPCNGFDDMRKIAGLLYFFGSGSDFLSP